MGEEAQKRNTDCVYFLASPLTCKKGNDCEYRHSESARVNPRDCRYWLSGNCLNANCSFRHPPLDGRPVASASGPLSITGGNSTATTSLAASGIASSSSAPALPSVSKSKVPCFFFSQGFCSKGGKCPFLHGPPAHFRKEATTYRKPQANEQLANVQGNGFSATKQQPQDRLLLPQTKSPAKTAVSSQEAREIPNASYKLAMPGSSTGPASFGNRLVPFAGEVGDRFSVTGRLEQIHNVDERSRQGQPVENRIPQPQFGDECSQQVPPGDKDLERGQLLLLDLPKGINKQSSLTHIARTSEGFFSLETQEMVVEQEVLHGTCGIHAGDLRNHLVKRRRNDNAHLSEPNCLQVKEHSGDRLESGWLASRAVSVLEAKESVSTSTKRARQDKGISGFTGPKSLAQIKAEKTRAGIEGSFKAVEELDGLQSQVQCNSDYTVAPGPQTKREVPPDSELHDETHSEGLSNGDGKESLGNLSSHGMASVSVFEEPQSPSVMPKKKQVSVYSDNKGLEGFSQKPAVTRPGLATKDIDSPPVSLRVSKEVDSRPLTHNIAVYSSEGTRKGDDHQLDGGLSSSLILHRKEFKQSLSKSGSEGTAGRGTRSYDNIDAIETGGNATKADYSLADDVMEDGTEADDNATHADYMLDDDEEDDFARKLGGFLT